MVDGGRDRDVERLDNNRCDKIFGKLSSRKELDDTKIN